MYVSEGYDLQLSKLPEMIEFIDLDDERTLVHCNAGTSRAVSVAIG